MDEFRMDKFGGDYKEYNKDVNLIPLNKYANTVIIPMRSGSSGIKNKNIKSFVNLPLYYWTINKFWSLKKIDKVDRIIISSDSDWYLDLVKNSFGSFLGTSLILSKRPDQLSDNSTSTEDVCLHEMNKYYVHDGLVTIAEVTSPLVPIDALVNMIDIIDDFVDSSFIVYKDVGQFWKCDKKNNYKWEKQYNYRKMRQVEDEPLYREVGIWCTKVNLFRENKDRISGRVNPVIIDKQFGISINDDTDFNLAELVMKEDAPRIFKDRGGFE